MHCVHTSSCSMPHTMGNYVFKVCVHTTSNSNKSFMEMVQNHFKAYCLLEELQACSMMVAARILHCSALYPAIVLFVFLHYVNNNIVLSS